jgi:outer membrane protein assembly factor BamA
MRRTLAALALLAGLLAPTGVRAQATGPGIDDYAGVPVTDVIVSGNHVTRERVITRELRTAIGEPLDPEVLRRDRVRLMNLSIFASVQLLVTPTDRGVAVQIIVVEMPAFIPFPAFSITDETGVSVGLGVAATNFLGRNISLSGKVLLGGATTGGVSYRHPWLLSGGSSFTFEASLVDRDDEVRGFRENSLEIEPGLEIPLDDDQVHKLFVDVWYLGFSADQPGVTLTGGRDHLVQPRIGLSLDTRDSWRNPHSGWRNYLGAGYTLGNADYLRVDLDVRRFQPIADRHTLAAGFYAVYRGGTVNETFPGYLQFVMGGANSIRGYDVNVLGQQLFGRNQGIATLEYRFLLSPVRAYRIFKWNVSLGVQLAAFADAGTAWSEGGLERAWEDQQTGVGLGARLLIPGSEMFRFDLATDWNDVRFYIRGSTKFEAQTHRVR